MEFDSLARKSSVEWIGQAPHEPAPPGARPLLPAEDPFYDPPAGFAHAAPGTVLRSRDVELAFLGLIPQRMRATQLLYRTTDRNDVAQAAVTTVLVPADRGPHCPIVSYQCAIDAADGRCFPSYALRRRARAHGSFTQLEFVLIAAILSQGWAVSVPDHEGRFGHWGAPKEPGYHVLDALRAALGTERLELSPDAPAGLWGYSGGGLATGWAAEVCGDYAPDLNIVGAVLGSPVGDLGHTFLGLDGTFFSGLPAVMIATLAKVYPDLQKVIDDHATAEGKALLHSLESMTTLGAIMRMRHKSLEKFLDQPLQDVVELPAVQHVFDDTKLGYLAPKPPVLMLQAVHDQVISVVHIDHLAEAYANAGARVTYHRDLLSEHVTLHPLSAPMVMEWLRDRFADRPLRQSTVSSGWPALLNPRTYLGLARLGLVATRVVTGGALGRLGL
ncbi:lipase family protein [Mycolicibacter hiberniae]|uniref:lipase family protein n=1 Tax=Mycolicibacter hiberniae TaxID=29314 RepID=UPI000A163A0C|nr:lipase family protein [Mycolicibacter hiberniae]MCV7085234.1 lipase [Mycolicibacter hiberniae]ORV70483.1 lipase [Mycolicibacter hiberniae]